MGTLAMTSTDTAATPLRSSPVAPGVAGLVVLVVMLQSTGGLSVELLGSDLVLAVAGFTVTRTVLDLDPATGWAGLGPWYRRELALRVPLLVMTFVAVLVLAGITRSASQAGLLAIEGLGRFVAAGNWQVVPSAASQTTLIDPFGPAWLLGLVLLFALIWPALLTGLTILCRTGRVSLAYLLVLVAFGAWLIGPLRALEGADVAELALGGHVRACEWLAGAAAAAVSLELPARRRHVSRWEAPAVGAVGALVLIGMATLATFYPMSWLRLGGPGGAAFGAAVVLVALHLPASRRCAAALSRGFPAEIGRMAYPLLVLHSATFWLVQSAVVSARPFALLVIGGALAWLGGLLVQDGLVRRLRTRYRRWRRIGAALLTSAILAVVALSGERIADGSQETHGAADNGVALVLGASSAAELRPAIEHNGRRNAIVDGSHPGCGLLPRTVANGAVAVARTTASAQAPEMTVNCGDWTSWWPGLVGAAQPDMIVVDLAADAVPQGDVPAPCDVRFRDSYRALFARAVHSWTHDAPNRRVLLAVVPSEGGGSLEGPRRCLNGLLTEFVRTYGSVVPLDVDAGGPASP